MVQGSCLFVCFLLLCSTFNSTFLPLPVFVNFLLFYFFNVIFYEVQSFQRSPYARLNLLFYTCGWSWLDWVVTDAFSSRNCTNLHQVRIWLHVFYTTHVWHSEMEVGLWFLFFCWTSVFCLLVRACILWFNLSTIQFCNVI